MIVSDGLLIVLLSCIAAHSCHILLLEFVEKKLLPPTLKNFGNIWRLPAISVCLSLAIVITSALTKPIESAECLADSDVNADIGGIGILLGLFLPSVAIVLILLSGHWKAEPSGAKELCMAHLANLFYLGINLTKSSRNLNLRETIVACSSIDAVSASVSIAFSDKDVLAARKLVFVGFAMQFAAFATVGYTLGRLTERFPSKCLLELHHPTISTSKAMMWSYFAVRLFAAFSPIPTIWRIASRLNEMEHAPRESPKAKRARDWETLPATLFTNYLVFGSVALLQIVPTFSITQADLLSSAQKLISEWGQSAALIVAGVSMSHVSYSCLCLLSLQAMKHRLQVCQTNHTPVNWASPEWTWRYPLKLLKQRWPLCKLVLRSADELFVDIGQLLRNHELKLSQKEQDGLWQELIVAFDNYDATYVMDCLDRGAPDNRFHKDRLEYPLHMAARLGDMEILQRLLPSGNYETSAEDGRVTLEFKAQSDQYELIIEERARTSVYCRLLTRNADKKLPLQLAVDANQNDAVSWLLKRLLEIEVTSGHTSSAARNCVAEALAKVIRAEKLDILKLFSETWPQWETLELWEPQSGMIHPCWFALTLDKTKAAAFVISHSPSSYWDDEVQQNFSGFLETIRNPPEPQAEFWFAYLLEHGPTPPESQPPFRTARLLGVRKGYAKVLLDQGYDPGDLCGVALRQSAYTCSRFLANCADHLSSFSTEVLDCVVSNFSEFTDDTASLWAAAGARDWSEFLNTLKFMKFHEVENLIQAESIHGDCSRMVNAILYRIEQIGRGDTTYHNTYTARALTRLVMKSSYKPTTEVDSMVQLFITHGASVLRSSALAPSTLFDVLLGARLEVIYKPRKAILDMLIRAAVTEEIQDRSKAGAALRTCCEALVEQCAGPAVSIRILGCMRGLLGLGCDPETAYDGDETPKAFLENGLKDKSTVDVIEPTPRYKAKIIQIAIDMLSNWSEFHRNPTSSIPTDDFEDEFPKEEDYPESPWGYGEDDFDVSEVGSEEHLL